MNDSGTLNGSILIIDDESSNLRFLDRLLRRNGYTRIHATTCPQEGLEIFSSTTIDLVLLDLGMPGMDGFKVMEQLKRDTAPADYVPVLVLTGNPRPEVRNQALANGARDFLAKPFDPSEALLRIQNLLDTRFLQRTLARQNETLEQRVLERTQELEEAQREILSRLAMVAEYYDDDTADHTRRVATLSERIAREVGMPAAEASLLGRAALLHDVGKIAVPAGLTRKPGRLDAGERDIMQRHAVEGARVLSGSGLPLMQMAEQIARTHHERWDGHGYPDGLRGEEIPLSGRIVAVADVYDALTHARPYKDAWTQTRALAEIRTMAGTHLDRRIVEALERILAREPTPHMGPWLTHPFEAVNRPEVTDVAPARKPAASGGAARSAARSVLAALLLMGVLLGLPTAATGQQGHRVGGVASVTIPPLARITTMEERALAAPAGETAIEVTLGVRANTSYRVSVVMPADAPDGMVVWIDTAAGPRALRSGGGLVVASGSRAPTGQVHVVTVRLASGSRTATRSPVLFQVDVN